MNINTELTKKLKTVLETCQAIEASLRKEEKLVSDSASELASMEASADLFDGSALNRLSTLLTISQIGPKRLEARRGEFGSAKEALIDTGNQFVLKTLGPRYRDLEAKALAKAEAKLRPMFSDPDSLREAAYRSSALVELRPIEEHTVMRQTDPEEAMPLARKLLEAWGAADAFEKRYFDSPPDQ